MITIVLLQIHRIANGHMFATAGFWKIRVLRDNHVHGLSYHPRVFGVRKHRECFQI